MSLSQNALANSIFDRAKNIIVKPKDEWEKIAGEQATIAGLYKNYALIMAALPAVGSLVYALYHHAAVLGVVTSLIRGYVTSLIMIAAMAYIIDFLAPKLGGQSNQINAFKLCTYSMTAAFIAGGCLIIPFVGPILGLFGLYSLYLFYLGVTPLMKTPASQAGIFTVIAFVIGAVVAALLGAIIP